MKKMLEVVGLLVILAVLFTGCNVTDNLKSKSWNIGVATIGGKLTTAVDPSTGTPLPSIELVEANGDIMSHKPGDGTQITYTMSKSMWSGETASRTFRMNAKGGMKSFLMQIDANGNPVINGEEYDANIATEDVIATAVNSENVNLIDPSTVETFTKGLSAALIKNNPEVNSKIKTMLIKERELCAENSKFKARFNELTKMPDAQLRSLKAGNDPVDNRIVGNETLWRVINARK